MSDGNLRLVSSADIYDLGRKPETLPERVRRMQQEAQVLACEEIESLRLTLSHAVEQALAIREGGEVFPVGVREQCRQLADNLPMVMQTLQALSERQLREISGGPVPPVWKHD